MQKNREMISPFVQTPELHLSVFKGPFDLLYQLLYRGEIPWAEIPLTEVAEGFESYVEAEDQSAFLSHFVHLAWLKVQSFFPKESVPIKEGETSSILEVMASFTTALLYREKLEEQESLSSLIYHRKPLPLPPSPKEPAGIDLNGLQALFKTLLHKPLLPPVSVPSIVETPLEEAATSLYPLLRTPLSFKALFEKIDRLLWVPYFLALLQGIKEEKIGVEEVGNDMMLSYGTVATSS